MKLGDDISLVARTCKEALQALADADWHRKASDLDWSCRTTLTHILSALSYYATNLALRTEEPRSGGQANEVLDVADLLDALEGRAEVLALVCDTSPTDARGAHTYGRSDPAGFAAMACDEMLIHTADIVAGLGAGFDPPQDVCARVLERLFPWAPDDEGDACATLLWANGRAPLGERPRLEPDWVWLSVPLAEWSGEDPNR
jgi:hypothetical protein